MQISTISQPAEETLIHEEGEVLRAYLCPAGVWTIGVGLTAGSGVITPRAGMEITKRESRALLHRALERNFNPRVQRAGLALKQNVFDGSVLFDFNTGRIHNATWVNLFKSGDLPAAERSFKQWVRGGGRVLPGLVRRRDTEWNMIGRNVYPAPRSASRPPAQNRDAVSEYQKQLSKLGYDPGPIDGINGPRTKAAVRSFQADHDLTIDGIVGPATRATLKRALDAKAANRNSAAGGVGAGGATAGTDATTSGEVTIDTALWATSVGVTAAILIAGLYLVWRYRGPLFRWLPEGVKDWFEDRGITLGRRVRT